MEKENKNENIIKSECDQIKDNIKPSEELINKTISKVRKVQEERIYKRAKNQRLFAKVLGTFTAIVIVAEGASFAFKKQDILSVLFSKVDKGIETAIEYGDIKNIDMDYIEIKDGLKIKPEFVLMNEYNFDLVFKFDGVDEFCKKNGIEKIEEIRIPDLFINDNNGTIFLSDTEFISTFTNNSIFQLDNNIYYILHCYNTFNNFPSYTIKNLDIAFSNISVNNNNNINNNINFNIDINDINLDKTKKHYTITNVPDYINKYNITLSSTNLKVELFFNSNSNIIDKTKTILKDSNRNIYHSNGYSMYNKDYLILVFPISNYQEIDNLKLNLNINNKNEKITLEKQD